MFFRGPGEFDPSSRGVYSMGKSFILPTPSTIAGALATLFGSNFSPSQDWISEYISVLGKIAIRGPIISIINKKKTNSSNVYLDFSLKNKLLSYDALNSYATKIKSIIEEEDYAKKEKMLDELDEELKGKTISPKIQERIGIGLKMRKENIKVVDEDKGLIYSAQYIDYSFGEHLLIEAYYEIIGESKVKTGSYHTRLGAGYSLLNNKRKPIYQALVPGSLIFLGEEKNGGELYRNGLGFAKEIGYGTVIPLYLK